MDEAAIADVEVAQTSASTEVAESSPAVETSGESQGGVNATDDAQGTQQVETPADVLDGLPTLEELKAQAEQKVPMAQGLYNVRAELERVRPILQGYEALDSWKPVVETVGDPELARSAYELVGSLYTPSTENPSGFDPRPFLEKVETDSPGTVDQLFSTICSFPIQVDGQTSTVVRELYKAHGLDPDRIDDYRNIDNLRASGVVTADDLTKIPEKYHDAFRSLSQAAREDLIEIMGVKPLVAEEALRNAQDALEARQYREREEQAKAEQATQQEAAFRQQVETAVTEGVNAKIEAWSNSIHQSLSQWKPSTDDAINEFEYAKVIATIAALQSPSPAYRSIAVKALGGDEAVKPLDDLINQWSANYSAAVTYEQMGQKDSVPAQRAQAAANQAEQRILIKLNDLARRLSEPTSTRTAQASQQQANQLAAAAGRFVPANGSTGLQSGSTNPYLQNPHPVGSQEYFAFNRKIDREYQMDNASVFSG